MTTKERYLDLEDPDGMYKKAHVFIGEEFLLIRFFGDDRVCTFNVSKEYIKPLAEHLAKALSAR